MHVAEQNAMQGDDLLLSGQPDLRYTIDTPHQRLLPFLPTSRSLPNPLPILRTLACEQENRQDAVRPTRKDGPEPLPSRSVPWRPDNAVDLQPGRGRHHVVLHVPSDARGHKDAVDFYLGMLATRKYFAASC